MNHIQMKSKTKQYIKYWIVMIFLGAFSILPDIIKTNSQYDWNRLIIFGIMSLLLFILLFVITPWLIRTKKIEFDND